MKVRFLALFLCLAVALSLAVIPASAASVVLSGQKLRVDGEYISCEKYNIDDSNYFKLRDMAYLLNGTGSQFAVGWNESTKTVTITTGEAYTPIGGELSTDGGDKSKTAVVSKQTIVIDGKARSDLSVYNIGGNNYFKLRDLGAALGFNVDYDAASNTAIVESIGKATITIPKARYSKYTCSDVYEALTVTAENSGRYRVEIDSDNLKFYVGVEILNSKGELVNAHNSVGPNGFHSGLNADFEAGKSYQINCNQDWMNENILYEFTLWKAKAKTDISKYCEVYDSFEYEEQLNCYTFIPAVEGTYVLSMVGDDIDLTSRIEVTDSRGEIITASGSFGEYGISDKLECDFVAGREYTIAIENTKNFVCDYTLLIANP